MALFDPMTKRIFSGQIKRLIVFVFCTCSVAAHGQGPLVITRLTGDFYIYETFNEYKGSRIPANGSYAVTRDGVVLFDTPWDLNQLQPLLDSIHAKHNKHVVLCIATHFHEDRTGGLEYYSRRGIKTYTTVQTDALSKANGKKRAAFLIRNDTTFTVGQYSFETFYPGPGHTADNIVVWCEQEKILYGGCLVKSKADHDLGNLADANVNTYASSIKKVIEKFRNPNFVIPGHNSWSSPTSLQHTLKMAEKLKKSE